MDTFKMENVNISDLDFVEKQDVSQIATPDRTPAHTHLRDLPTEILKTTTVENLISQNDDLMSRLKVALRRLSILELENQRLAESNTKERLSASASYDQLLVLKEKDNLWKSKVETAERERDIFREKILISDKKQAAMQLTIDKLQSEVNRYQKYHDRIKSNVKPYVNQLRTYIHDLEQKLNNFEQDANKNEALIRDLRYQIVEVTKNSTYQLEQEELKQQELIESYENTIKDLQSEILLTREAQADLEHKAIRLHRSLEKQDELENKVIEIQRTKDEQKVNFEKEFERLSNKIQELQRTNTRLDIEHRDLQNKVVDDFEKIKILERKEMDLSQQLEGLRFMWNAKNEEADKLKITLNALENLNLELSSKINEMRTVKS